MTKKIIKDDDQWRIELTEEVSRITRRQGTEYCFTGKYWDHYEQGIYCCVCCGEPLFSSDTKFESFTGWPSFFAVIDENSISIHPDEFPAMRRSEIVCARCDAHLGHLFEDGPEPTGLRYCVNSAALQFHDAKK